MNIFEDLLADISIPKFARVSYQMDDSHIEDIEGAVRQALLRPDTMDRIRPGDSVCITAGSRDVANISCILKTLCSTVKERGAHPFIIPAMGSHGGARADGQAQILAGFGITGESMGAPVRSSMDTNVIGYTPGGLEVHMDRYADAADHIICVGRIKAHTSFRGPVESGLCKMLVIGMGKQHGAYQCHQLGFERMPQNILDIARVVIEKKPNLFGLGIIENAYHQTCRIEAVPGRRIPEEEPGLLEYAKSQMPHIPFARADILILDEIGKDISGAGMDTNITGRSSSLGNSAPYFQRIVVLDLTDQSHGNFAGAGYADIATERFYKKIDFEQTYPNAVTAAGTEAVRLPVIMPDDRTAVKLAIRTATAADHRQGVKIVWLKNTLCLSEFRISEALIPEAKEIPGMEILTDPEAMRFRGGG